MVIHFVRFRIGLTQEEVRRIMEERAPRWFSAEVLRLRAGKRGVLRLLHV
jgi:hypothetical protein